MIKHIYLIIKHIYFTYVSLYTLILVVAGYFDVNQ